MERRKANVLRGTGIVLSVVAGYFALRGFLDEAVCFNEQWGTFYWNRFWLEQEWAKEGALANLTVLFFRQFFATVNGTA